MKKAEVLPDEIQNDVTINKARPDNTPAVTSKLLTAKDN
jgi:hypothetical protein